jgi:uncharacterized membrane protein YidH (DUF202 family)
VGARRINRTKQPVVTLAAAWAGMIGPVLFAAVLAALTALQYEFMVGIGWRPIQDPAGAWPSGLALGPQGRVMNAAFVLSGVLLIFFSIGLGRAMGAGSRVGPALLFLSGFAMALLAFETDPIDRTGPRTPHGLVHDTAFVVFAVALLLALFVLWRRMGRDPAWRPHARYTLATAIICAVCLVIPGLAYYVFLVAALVWIEVTAIRLLTFRRV